MQTKINTDQVKRLRMGRALTQAELAELAGVDTKTIEHAELGWPLKPATIKGIAAALGLEPEEITCVVD